MCLIRRRIIYLRSIIFHLGENEDDRADPTSRSMTLQHASSPSKQHAIINVYHFKVYICILYFASCVSVSVTTIWLVMCKYQPIVLVVMCKYQPIVLAVMCKYQPTVLVVMCKYQPIVLAVMCKYQPIVLVVMLAVSCLSLYVCISATSVLTVMCAYLPRYL